MTTKKSNRIRTALALVGASLGLCSPSFAQSIQTPGLASTTAIDLRTLDRLHAPILRSDLGLLGAQSCAAASCHGGPHPAIAQPWVSRGAEYPLWFENDPHSKSWKTISSTESVAMMRQLKIMKGNEIVDQKGFDNCLACHNTTKRFHEPRSSVERKEGVGCSGCHGPEELWNGNHYQYGFDSRNSTDIGFVANEDLLTRARTCAACHVGDQDRDMNHDIIAAGHPALRYELATFHARQPKHWRDSESADKTYYEAQLWLAGQIAAADASLSLIKTRAMNSHSISEWPELSVYDCSSCHHTLGLQNTRRTPADGKVLAIAPLSTWNTAGLMWLIRYRLEQGQGTPEDDRLLYSLDAVREVIESGPTPDPNLTAAIAQEARLALAAWVDGTAGQFERASFRSERLGNVAASAAGKSRSFDTWESAVQLYLAAVAARESWPGGSSGPMLDVAEKLRRGLAYPQLTSSPEFALRARKGPTATRAEVRRSTLELVGWLGPVVLDQEPMPAELETSPEQSKRELELLLKQMVERRENERKALPPAVPGAEKPMAPQLDKDPSKPIQPKPVQPEPAKPKPMIKPEDLLKQLEALQGDEPNE